MISDISKIRKNFFIETVSDVILRISENTRYTQHIFDEAYIPTENAHFITKEIKMEDRYISAAQFWDTAGSQGNSISF